MSLAGAIDYLATKFGTINGITPYSTTVVSVNEIPTNPLRGLDALSPAVNITLKSERFEDDAEDVSSVQAVAVLMIEGCVRLLGLDSATSNPQAPHDALLPLRVDVVRALRADPKCGGAAIDSSVGNIEYFGGESDATFELEFTVRYSEAIP